VSTELNVNAETRIDRVGHTGIYPLSGPRPAGDALLRGQGELGHPEARVSRASTWSGDTVWLGLGRALFGGYFLYNAINHFMNRGMMTEYARSKGVRSPDVAVLGSGAMIGLGGLSLLTGLYPKAGASLIVAFLLGVTPQMHAFWDVEDEQQRTTELVNFMKNIALIGGASLAAAIPEPWPGSVGRRTQALAHI
jgi:putative oxidoreductase